MPLLSKLRTTIPFFSRAALTKAHAGTITHKIFVSLSVDKLQMTSVGICYISCILGLMLRTYFRIRYINTGSSMFQLQRKEHLSFLILHCKSVRIKTAASAANLCFIDWSQSTACTHFYFFLFVCFIIWFGRGASLLSDIPAAVCSWKIGTLCSSVSGADGDYSSSWSFMKFTLSSKSSGQRNQSAVHILIPDNIMYIRISIYIHCLWMQLCVQKQTGTLSMLEPALQFPVGPETIKILVISWV